MCSAAVQLDAAHAYGAPTYAPNSRSKAATSGPCVSQPDRMARRAAAASASPSDGRAIGMSGRLVITSDTNDALPLLLPPSDERLEPFVERNRRIEPEVVVRASRIR